VGGVGIPHEFLSASGHKAEGLGMIVIRTMSGVDQGVANGEGLCGLEARYVPSRYTWSLSE